MEAASPPSQPQSQRAGKRIANTSTASLHANTDIAAAVSKAVSAALTALDAKFETRFNTLQQAIADTKSSLNALKSYTEATNTSVNALKNYTENTTAEIQARLERRQRGPQTHNSLIMARLTLTMWQWDCRGYSKKRSHVQQLVKKRQADPQATQPVPDVIALQETSTPSPSPVTRPTISPRTDNSLFILNVYSSPREKAADFSHLFSEAIALVGDAQLLLLGDFNARHPDWGYMHTDPKGRKLWSLVQDLRLTLLNDPQQPLTRIGNSVCRDTSPDLTLCKNTTGDLPTTDSRLLHMWDAHAGLLRRWRRQHHNKKLRRRIKTLLRKIENHSLTLTRQQWGQLCDGLTGQMSSKRTLTSREAPPETLLPYSGKTNPQLDEDITQAEIYAAMLKLHTTSAPGPDGVSNKSLRNLDAKSVAALTQYANECLRSGHIRHDLLRTPPKAGTRAVLGERTYNYVCDFLSNRTTEFSLTGGSASKRLTLGDRGTP
ncbi:hypothetical protein HPB52_005082 [Rhipicephalus sanguineus]|uniref:Endonuclease/exonuclease/phosphatase domain-containing protein n=1 Tax=Rhipicephalus sanguineus TaxID=34632 RepID=A0A9D4Q4T1_RHISA|nr:hypothetical protein HPB52_005082 [Rhipicephalus sanguineus]